MKRAGLRVKRGGKWVNLAPFHDTRRTAITAQIDLGIRDSDITAGTRRKTIEMHRRYNQTKQAAERVRQAQNAALKAKTLEPAPVASTESGGDWKAELKELKTLMMDQGVLTAEEFTAEKVSVLANRKRVRYDENTPP